MGKIRLCADDFVNQKLMQKTREYVNLVIFRNNYVTLSIIQFDTFALAT